MFEGFTETDVETEGAVIRLRHGGSGPPLLLLRGYPQTHVCWHKAAPLLTCPLLALWGESGMLERQYDVLAAWRERAADVCGRALDCGHFLPEEAPRETARALIAFFGGAGN